MNGEGARQGAPATQHPAATIAADLDDDLRVRVLRFLVEHPAASASEVARDVRGRRGDVLRLCKALRAAGVVSRPPGDSQAAGTGSPRVADGSSVSAATCPACGADLDVEVRSR